MKLIFICEKSIRLDRMIQEKVRSHEISNSWVRKAIISGNISINGTVCRKPDRLLKSKDRVLCNIEAPIKSDAPTPVLNVVYRDRFIIAVDKPPGLPTHRTSDPDRMNLHDLLHRFLQPETTEPPALLHRLDAATSGLILFTTDRKANAALARQFEDRTVEKHYLALISVSPNERLPPTWRISNHLARSKRRQNRYASTSPGNPSSAKPAITDVTLLWQHGEQALLDVQPLTGRPHQIRVHLSEEGHPIMGDSFYGGKKADRLMLHAWKITFMHPVTMERVQLEAGRPPHFDSVPNREQ